MGGDRCAAARASDPGIRSQQESGHVALWLRWSGHGSAWVAGRLSASISTASWNELSRDQKRFDEAKRQHYAALYAQPRRNASGLCPVPGVQTGCGRQQDVSLAQGKLQMPVLAFGGEATFGPYDRRGDAVCRR